jgi:hypothetical protein
MQMTLKERSIAALPYVLVVLAAVVCSVVIDPISRNDSHYWRMVLSGVGIVMVLLRGLAARLGERGTRAHRMLLVGLCTLGVFNYFQFDKRVFLEMGDPTDTTYYYTNSKYLGELGYFGMYAAVLTADREHNDRHATAVRKYRDLRDYEVKSASVGFAHGEEVKQRFSPERWEAFKQDMDYFLPKFSRHTVLSNFFVDHGYNPPPTWTFIGGNIANITPVEKVHWITQIDTLLIAAMFVGIAWAFGFETMLWCLLFFVVTFSGRWPILGQSLMRFDWVAALILSVCMFKKERWVAAGVFMAFAGLNRVFPMIFFYAWGVVFVAELWRNRAVAKRHVQFMAGVGVVGVFLLGGSLLQYGTQTFKDSAHNLHMHSLTYSSHRVGLGDLLVFRGETTRDQINAGGGVAKKEKQVQALQPVLRLAGVLALLFVGYYIVRSRKPEYQLVHLAVLPFFCLTNPQINYYNLRVLLIAWHGHQLDKPMHRAGLVALLLVELATQATKVAALDRYTTTTTTSIGLALYLLGLMLWMVRDLEGKPWLLDRK